MLFSDGYIAGGSCPCTLALNVSARCKHTVLGNSVCGNSTNEKKVNRHSGAALHELADGRTYGIPAKNLAWEIPGGNRKPGQV